MVAGILCTSWYIMSTICVILSSSVDMVEAQMPPLLVVVVVVATVVAGSSLSLIIVRCDENHAKVQENHEFSFGFGKETGTKRAGGC